MADSNSEINELRNEAERARARARDLTSQSMQLIGAQNEEASILAQLALAESNVALALTQQYTFAQQSQSERG